MERAETEIEVGDEEESGEEVVGEIPEAAEETGEAGTIPPEDEEIEESRIDFIDSIENYIGKRKSTNSYQKGLLIKRIKKMTTEKQTEILRLVIEYVKNRTPSSDIKMQYNIKVVDGKTTIPVSKLPDELVNALAFKVLSE
jgi:hypothetical protein